MTHRIAAVVLAAGAGRRFGGVKPLAAFEGEPLVRRAVNAARAAGADPVIVVLGAHADDVAAVQRDEVRIVVNGAWATGIASSVRAGIESVASDADGVLITTIDQPLVSASMLRTLVDAFETEHAIVAASYDDTIGIPVVIGRAHLADLAASLAGDRGAGPWLRAHRAAVTTVPLPAAAHDADTAEALRAMEQGDLV